MDVDEQSLLGTIPPAEGKTPLPALEAAFELGRDVSPHLAAARPVRWAAVHFAEGARNARNQNYLLAWEEVLWPLVGSFQALSEDGLPVGIVNDHQLERGELGGYRVLVLPDRAALTPRAAAVGGGLHRGRREGDRERPGLVVGRPRRTRGGVRRVPGGDLVEARRNGAGPGDRRAARPLRRVLPQRRTPCRRGDQRLQLGADHDEADARRSTAAPDKRAGASGRRRPRHLAQGPRPAQAWDGFPFRASLRSRPSRRRRSIERLSGGYRVTLPAFDFIALLVVGHASRPPMLPHQTALGPTPVAPR